jgi:endonuclease III
MTATQQIQFNPLQEKIEAVYELLLAQQGARALLPRREPMRELISTMLSHRTTHQNEELAYTRMWERFPSWEAIRDAPVDELTEALRSATFPEVKAPNIKAALAMIIAERGRAEIDFLADLPPGEGLAWLMRLPGVGIKTASLVLLFCFAKPVLPVDVHVHRVSQRLGLVGKKVDATAAHPLLQAMLPDDPLVLYNFHVAMLRHGQRVCVWNTPKCEQCVLREWCDWYQARKKPN